MLEGYPHLQVCPDTQLVALIYAFLNFVYLGKVKLAKPFPADSLTILRCNFNDAIGDWYE